jgi:hypothetical protein
MRRDARFCSGACRQFFHATGELPGLNCQQDRVEANYRAFKLLEEVAASGLQVVHLLLFCECGRDTCEERLWLPVSHYMDRQPEGEFRLVRQRHRDGSSERTIAFGDNEIAFVRTVSSPTMA